MANVSLKQFLGQSALLWLSQLLGVVVSVIAGVIITRELGPEGRGIYTWLLTLAAVGSSVAVFGMDMFNRREIPANPKNLPAILKLNLWVILGGGFGVALALGIFAWFQPSGGGVPLWIALAMATVPLGALSMALVQALVSQGRIKTTALLVFLPRLLLAAAVVSLWWVNAVNLDTVMFVSFGMNLIGGLVPVWLLREHLSTSAHVKVGSYLKSMWRTGSATYAAGLSYYLMQKVDVLMIGHYMDKASTGYYGVASNLADVMITPISVLAGLLATRLAAGQWNLARKVVGVTMAASALGCVFTYAITPWLIPFLFGAEFQPAVPVLQLLCPAVFVLSWFLLMQNALTATGRARYLAIPSILGCVLNIGFNMALIPSYGLVGACWASILAYGITGVCATVLLKATK